MDAETEVLSDDSFETLLRKAVTVSQTNLPMVTIDQDIDEIASSYSCENQSPVCVLDDDVLRLIERTRQRRELLNQKMGKTPEAAPRKRRTPLSEDQTDNVGEETNQTLDDSPKRQCVRGSEQDIKPDTPAIPSVKSRLQNLARQHVPFSEDFGSAGDKEESAPVPTPRKSISSPPPARAKATDCDTRENTQPSTGRKGRFAQLAQIVSNWEDDLSHPTIVKEEEKKPRWQPPKPADTPSTVQQVNTPKKTRAPLPPSSSDSSTTPTPPSPQKAATISSAEISSPTKLSAKMSFNSSPRPYMPYSERTNKVSPVKSPASSKSNLAKCSEAQKAIQPNDNKVVASALNKTPRTAAKAPSDRPMSARLANWEQKISETKPDVAATPKSGLAASSAVSHTLRQACTPARPLGTPARLLGTPARPLSTPIHKTEDMQVQMRPKVRKSIDDEPTAHPVSARKSAWEQMSSAQVISDIKKVKPGDCTPVRPMMPAASRQTPGKVTSATPSLEPKKSFKDSIKEKAAEVNPSSATRASATQRLSPKKASEAMKSVQEQLVQKTQSTDMAERLRQERMVELQAIQNRWKNGILNERGDEDEETATEQPNAAPTTTNNRREVNKERARADTDGGEAENAFWKLSESNKRKRVKVEHNNVTHSLNQETKAEDKISPKANLSLMTSVANNVGPSADSNVNVIEEMVTDSTTDLGSQISSFVDLSDDSRIAGNDKQTEESNVYDIQSDEGAEKSVAEMATEKSEDVCKDRELCGDMCEAEGGESVVSGNGGCAAVETGTEKSGSSPLVDTAGEQDNTVVKQDECTNSILGEELSKGSNFDSKLASLGFDVLENQTQKQSGLYPKLPAAEGAHNGSGHLYPSLAAPKAPPLPSTSASNVTGKPPRPKTLFNIVSLQKKDAKTSPAISAPPPVGTSAIKVCRKVKFDDSFESDDSVALAKKQEVEHNNKPVTGIKEDISEQSDTTQDDSESGVVFRQPHPAAEKLRYPTDDDDLSLSAFVPESVRRQSILPPPNQKSGQNLDTSFGSLDSFEGAAGAPPDMHKSTTNLVRLGQQYGDSSSSLDSSYERPTRAKPNLDDTEDSLNGRDAIDDLLEEAMDSDSAVPSTSTKESPVQMRKRPSHRKATEKGSLPFSVDEYRASRNMQVLEVKQVITRNSLYVGMDVREEEVEMPTIPVPAPRQNIQERVKELQELVQHEQNIIMQTSNALNQCCSSSSHFAGSQEQVECNRLLLISCQKRQSFMAEIQRLRDSRKLDEDGPGPKGSLTISDIRLPLKKEFVTRIGTYHDTTTYYFILLIRNGPQVICTQMLSTHDPMMRGSLDFPNLIKINGITGNFRVELEIYSMSVSKESLGKDKKKKTPKKVKGSTLTVQSPGGPMAVRTTSFSQVTTIQLTMRSLDKHSFNLDRLSHLSPLHGTIYMNLKCIMEAHIEERGFLTMFEDVSGLGSWHRRWCVLSGNKLQYWKYPDDESRRDPIGYIDLKRCTTEKVGLISRDICARPNTFELELARQPRKGERDTLVSRTYDTMTTVRHMLSADTKEERIVWCNKLNRALANIRTWHCDALRPAKLPHVKSCY